MIKKFRNQLVVLAWMCLTAASHLYSAAGLTPTQAAERPNIVYVLFDDMGWGQPPSYRSESALRTPHLDELANQGMRFTDAHSASAVCTPTRYGLLTGRYPWRLGQFGVLTTYSKPIIPTDQMTVASLLKSQGYATACIGKWHLGVNWVDGKPGQEKQVPIGAQFSDGPNALGFDYFYGFTHARNIGTVLEQDRVVAHAEAIDNQPLMIAKALQWIDKQAKNDAPFFLYFPMCPPHEPLVPTAEYSGKSGAKDLVQNNPKYGDWVYQGDAMLGEIMDTLQNNGLAENTLLIAASDNGAEHRAYAPLRDSKRSIYEGGHRVPFVVRWPGKVEAGSSSAHTVCLNDLLATAADLLSVALPADAGEDSVSMLPILTGTADRTPREATVHQSSKGDLAIRRGAWKAIFHKNGKRELFQLENDLSETQDVWEKYPNEAAGLTALMQKYIEQGRSTPGEPQMDSFTPKIAQ